MIRPFLASFILGLLLIPHPPPCRADGTPEHFTPDPQRPTYRPGSGGAYAPQATGPSGGGPASGGYLSRTFGPIYPRNFYAGGAAPGLIYDIPIGGRLSGSPIRMADWRGTPEHYGPPAPPLKPPTPPGPPGPTPPSVPGPLPILGAAAAFRASRKLRSRLSPHGL